MKTNKIRKIFKTFIFMIVIMFIPLILTTASSQAIYYKLADDKSNAVIHIDVNRVIGNNDLIEVKDQNNNLLTGYDITVMENGIYTYTISYKEVQDVVIDSDTIETSEKETITKNEKLEITVEGIELKEDVKHKQTESSYIQDTQFSQSLQASQDITQNTRNTPVETDAKYFDFNASTGTITKFKYQETPTITDVIIPSTINGTAVKTIGNEAFLRMPGLTSVIIPESVTTIEARAFYSCSLDNVTIPSHVELIGTSAFEYCTTLENIEFKGSVKQFGSGVFRYCKSIKSIHLPEGLEKTGMDTFAYCEKLVEVTLPTTLKSIATQTFENCSSLKNVIIPNNIESIESGAFSHCSSLEQMKLPDNLKTMEVNVFKFCTQLKTIVIPKQVTKIEARLFQECTSLESIVLPDNIDTIGVNAFEKCQSLKEITIPEKVQSIPKYAFTQCLQLKKVNLSSQITNIGEAAFAGCESLTDIILPQVITEIGDYAFQKCISLANINLPASIEVIGEEAFEGCALPSANFESPEKNPSVTVNAFINQRAVIHMYHTSDGDYVNFNEYTPLVNKITLSGNDFTMLDNGIAKANIKNPDRIMYSYPVLGRFEMIKFSAISTFHTFYVYKAQFLCDGKTLEEKYVLEDEEIVLPAIPKKEGYTGIWDKTDKVIQRDEVFHVVYKAQPYISGNNKVEIDQGSSFHPNDTFIFKDADGNIINDVIFTGKVDTNKPGEYVIEYDVIDQWGGKTKGECIISVKTKEDNKDEIVLPGEDGEIGTDDDIIVRPGTIDDKGNIIIPDGGTIIYPDGSQEDFPNGAVIKPGDDGQVGTKDDIIIDSGSVDDQGNIIISNGGAIIYPDGKREEFPNGGVIITDKNGDEIIVKSGQLDNQGNIIISDGGMIIYPDGTRKSFPKGGIIRWGKDGKLEIEDLNEVNNQGLIYIEQKNTKTSNHVLTNDNTQLLLWSLVGMISMTNIIMLVKKRFSK